MENSPENPDDAAMALRMAINRMIIEVETLAAVTLALGRRSGDAAVPAAMVDAVDAAATAVVPGIDRLDPNVARPLASLGRAMLVQAAAFAAAPNEPAGWAVTDSVLLQSLGQASAALAPAVADLVVPRFDGLEQRLGEPGAAIVDIGVGVGALAVAFAQRYPGAKVVGLDIWEPALALAATNVERARLADRVELRRCDVVELDAPDTFDLAWFAGPFIPGGAHVEAFDRIHRSLRPGGVIVYGTFGGSTPLHAALADLRTLRSGGPVRSDDEVAELLESAGFDEIVRVGADIGLPARFVAGRRN